MQRCIPSNFSIVKFFDIVTLLAIAVILSCDIDEPRRKRRKWTKDWYLKRKLYGHVNLFEELRAKEPEDYRNFLHNHFFWDDHCSPPILFAQRRQCSINL